LSLRLLASDPSGDGAESPVRLEVQDAPLPSAAPPSPRRGNPAALPQRLLAHLRQAGPAPHRQLRSALRVRDKRLSEALRGLEADGRVARTPQGWNLTPAP
jgi:hypothetical protein